MRRIRSGVAAHVGELVSLRCCGSLHRVLSDPSSKTAIHGWVNGVDVDDTALKQIEQLTQFKDEIIRHPIAVMPDVHAGVGCTIGTVIPTSRAIIPASVGVDIGCGMIAVKTSLTPEDLPGRLDSLRLAIEVRVPHGRTHSGKTSQDAGAWRKGVPDAVATVWKRELDAGFQELCQREPSIASTNNINHLGTLGTGNHFVEICVDDDPVQKHIWVMLHSGSRGVGNRIGSIFIEKARKDMAAVEHELPNKDLAYFREGTQHFNEYVAAVEWAQSFAYWNRALMMDAALQALREAIPKPFTSDATAINCHHNYVERYETPEGERLWLTRKGATSAKRGEMAIIPGSMGAKSFIVRGKGNPMSYCSCSHGAGRRYGRNEAKRRFTLDDHVAATNGIECRKDAGVLDETPAAYKDIDAVMAAQSDLVEVVAVLKQLVCVKG